jgi:hypothetical protein
MTFEEMLPLLASSYEAGLLVPFIGAGMSRKKFAGWGTFVGELEKRAGLCPNQNEHIDVTAQRAASTIRNGHNEHDAWKIIAESLRGEDFDKPNIPEQTAALANIYWPLTISTNYDHLFYCACRGVSKDRLRPMVLGRSAEDCKQVMAALVSPFDRETIWHIQGFLGETCPCCDSMPVQDKDKLARLQREMVIGHSEYRQVANTAVHFRRCFGEVFKSRSFLFLGSGLSEEYFWNLFGETLELCGPSPVPHFAFLPKSNTLDVRFLAEQMNIAVCEYDDGDDHDDHAQLTSWLRQLQELIVHPRARISRLQVELPCNCSLEITPYAPIPLPETGFDHAVAVVVRACPEGLFELDRDLLDRRGELRSKLKGRFDERRHVMQVGTGIFAVRARTKPESESESDAVGRAVRELLSKLDSRCKILYLHLPSAGGTVPPVYGFIEAVRALGNWATQTGEELHVIAHVGDQVLLNLTSRHIGLVELLTSRYIRFWVVVNSEVGGETTRRVLYRTPGTLLREVLVEVLGKIDNKALRAWSISLCPSPRRGPLPKMNLRATLCDIGIVFGTVLTLTRKTTKQKSKKLRVRGAAAGAN